MDQEMILLQKDTSMAAPHSPIPLSCSTEAPAWSAGVIATLTIKHGGLCNQISLFVLYSPQL